MDAFLARRGSIQCSETVYRVTGGEGLSSTNGITLLFPIPVKESWPSHVTFRTQLFERIASEII
jgi:hypothetical protein